MYNHDQVFNDQGSAVMDPPYNHELKVMPIKKK